MSFPIGLQEVKKGKSLIGYKEKHIPPAFYEILFLLD